MAPQPDRLMAFGWMLPTALQKALLAVRQTVPRWKFKPGHIAGEPVTSWVVTNVRFTLDQ